MRAVACKSFAGFQSQSKRTSLLAPIKFNPTPPAFLESRKTDPPRPLLNEVTSCVRLCDGVVPSNRVNRNPGEAVVSAFSMTSSVDVHPDTTTTRSFSFCDVTTIRLNTRNLTLVSNGFVVVVTLFASWMASCNSFDEDEADDESMPMPLHTFCKTPQATRGLSTRFMFTKSHTAL